MSKILHRIPQAAQELNVTPKCIANWMRQEKIGFVRLGRAVRIPQEEIDRLIKEGFTPAQFTA